MQIAILTGVVLILISVLLALCVLSTLLVRTSQLTILLGQLAQEKK